MAAILVRFEWHGDGPGSGTGPPSYTLHPSPPNDRSVQQGPLRREIAPFGVQVVVVEPGAVNTGLASRAIATAHELVSTMTPEQRQRYGGLVQAITAQTALHTESGLPAVSVTTR